MREFHLFDKHGFLDFPRGIFVIIIKPDFADCDDFFVFRHLAKLVVLRGCPPRRFLRMNSDGRIHVAVVCRKREIAHARRVITGRSNDAIQPVFCHIAYDAFGKRIQPFVVKMAVRVDEHYLTTAPLSTADSGETSVTFPSCPHAQSIIP